MSTLETLEAILDILDIQLDSTRLGQLARFRTLLLDYNAHTNLTAIRDPQDVEVKLFADALALLPLIEAERLREGRDAVTLIDIGTGAGFPGLPLAIADPAINVVLVDSTRKKVDFVSHAIAQLNLQNAQAIHGRSEELAHDEHYRERFDIVTARAVSSLPALIELCLPFIRVGGLALLTKGRAIEDEIAAASNALGIIGGDLFDVYHPPADALDNTAIVNVRKFRPAPKKYPRSPGIPAKSPL